MAQPEFTRFQHECLARHNEHRAMHGAPPMHLTEGLNNMAQTYASKLAASKNVKHSDEESRRVDPGQLGCAGESLAETGTTGPAGQNPGSYFVDNWYAEIKDYDFNSPEIIKGSGHFTQEVWVGSTELGIGVASYKKDGWNYDVVVANYYPPGNVQGWCKGNILPKGSKVSGDKKTSQGESTQFQEECLFRQNDLRSLHGAPPLALSNRLNAMAQRCASDMAAKKKVKHSDDDDIRIESGQLGFAGENLASAGTNAPAIRTPAQLIVSRWYNEIKDYNFEKPGFAPKAGHFSQGIWVASREFGVGRATYEDNGLQREVVVAHYYPPGNIQGQFEKNVLPLKNKSAMKKQIEQQMSSALEKLTTKDDAAQKKEPSQGNKEENIEQFRSESLARHNKYRVMHGAPPIRLSKRLNDMAQNYAMTLAARKTTEHSDKESRRVESGQLGCAGENLALSMTTGSSLNSSGSASVDGWYEEIKDYDFNNPNFKQNTGHFTQVVWIVSTELGVGRATYQKDGNLHEIVVANYYPPGNLQGSFEKNVLRKK